MNYLLCGMVSCSLCTMSSKIKQVYTLSEHEPSGLLHKLPL